MGGNMGEEMILTTRDNKGDGTSSVLHGIVDQKGEFKGLLNWCVASTIMVKSPILGGIIYAVKGRRYRPTMSPGQTTAEASSSPPSATRRVGRHVLKCTIFTAIMTLAVCNHGSINVNGNKVYLRDALRNAANSNFW